MQERMQSILEEQKKRTMEVVRAAERSRAQMLCEKAAAEHDLVQVRSYHRLLPGYNYKALNFCIYMHQRQHNLSVSSWMCSTLTAVCSVKLAWNRWCAPILDDEGHAPVLESVSSC